MPKPITERQTKNPLGMKINQVLREKGTPGDYGSLARIFGVKTPSVYDWVTHGRLGKERYAKLVEWSQRSLHWWFDLPEIPKQSSIDLLAGRRTTDAISSPFPAISDADWVMLSSGEIHEIEIFAQGVIAGHRARKSRNGTT